MTYSPITGTESVKAPSASVNAAMSGSGTGPTAKAIRAGEQDYR